MLLPPPPPKSTFYHIMQAHMHGLPRLPAARTAISDYTALARTRLNELKVVLTCLMLSDLQFTLGSFYLVELFRFT